MTYKKYLPGMRILKTGFSVVGSILVINLLNLLFDLQLTTFFASLSAIIIIQADRKSTVRRAIHWGLGIVVGSIISVIIFYLLAVFNLNPTSPLVLFFGTMLTIHLCYLLSLYEGIIAACIIFLTCFFITDDSYLSYIITTMIQAIVASIVVILIDIAIFPYQEIHK